MTFWKECPVLFLNPSLAAIKNKIMAKKTLRTVTLVAANPIDHERGCKGKEITINTKLLESALIISAICPAKISFAYKVYLDRSKLFMCII